MLVGSGADRRQRLRTNVPSISGTGIVGTWVYPALGYYAAPRFTRDSGILRTLVDLVVGSLVDPVVASTSGGNSSHIRSGTAYSGGQG